MKLSTKELRIGNLVIFSEDGTIFTITEICETGVTVESKDEVTWIEIDQFEPIPLTEEWLLRFGFYKSSSDNNEFIDSKTGWFMVYENSGYYKLSTGRGLIGEQFKYVHQLQNLYFALTGKELEINEPRKEQP